MQIGKVASDEKRKKSRTSSATSNKKRKPKINREELSEEERNQLDLEQTDDDTVKSTYKKRAFMHKFRLGSHYKMERFTILLTVCLTSLLFFTAIGWNSNRIKTSSQVGTIAQYTSDIEFSISQAKGEIEGVFVNPEKTRGMVLLNMTDIESLPSRAEEYGLFLSVVEGQLQHEPSGSMIVFGSSGYMAIELYDEQGLDNKVLEFTLRSISDLAESTASEEELAALEDPSFGQFDQTRFYANLGASEATILPALSKELDPVGLYYALVGIHEEERIYGEINEQVATLNRLMSRHEEYATRLDDLGYVSPDMPVFMKGDAFTSHTEVVQQADPELDIAEETTEVFEYQPATTVYGGHEFEYFGKTLTDGYVMQVVDDVKDFRNYLSTKRVEAQQANVLSDEDASYSEEAPQLETIVRTLDGTEINLTEISQGDATSQELAAREASDQLNSVWNDYISTKRILQTETLNQLLLLDADVRTQGNGFSQDSSDEFMVIW